MNRMKLYLILAITAILGATPAIGDEVAADQWTKETKVTLLNAAAIGGVLTYGFTIWDYGDRTMHAKNEGWFGKGTDEGGSDKIGHLYLNYVTTRGFANLARYWGYDEEGAARVGALSALAFTSVMEVGDSFSVYGFSYEDFLINIAGSGLGYLLARDEELADLIDLRLEYYPRTSPGSDVATNYDNLTYTLALKFSGFERLKETPLRYFELLGGFYTRDFGSENGKRVLFAGIGLNVSELLSPMPGSGFFNYVQLPYTYLPAKHKF